VWHTESGYGKRSKVETTFYRYKTIVGSAMRARGLSSQRVEARIGCKILNRLSASIEVVHQGTGAPHPTMMR